MKIKDFLTSHNWCQGEYHDYYGRRCLVGAMNHCYPNLDERMEVLGKIVHEIGFISIEVWNDTHSFPEVKALVEKLDV